MLNKHLFLEKIKELVIYFPSWNFEVSDKNVRIWYNQFSDLTDNEFKRMVETYVQNEQYPPTVGSLRKYIVKDPEKNQVLEKIEEWRKEAEKVPESKKLEFKRRMEQLIKDKSNAK